MAPARLRVSSMTLGDLPSVSGARAPIERIGATVLKELVESIVSGEVEPGQTLPPEASLSADFGVSRTVIRESIKRLQEKGMVTVAQGRGTHVNPMSSWNFLDPLVLGTLIGHDDSLGVLDDLSIVRGALEAAMASTVAAERTDDAVERLRACLNSMRVAMEDSTAFREADVAFHRTVMDLSGNLLAENVASVLFDRALASTRYHGVDPERAFERTMQEHEAVVDAIAEGNREAARKAMEEHILGSWERRRLPTTKRGKQ